MELRQLEVFLAVAETRSFTAAAARLHVVQSAVSMAVRTLERDVGAALFDRTSRQVGLTDAGRALVAPARTTLEAAAAARDAVTETSDGTSGTVRIGIMHALPGLDLAAVITELHRERPGIQIVPSTHPEGSAGLLRDVAEHRLDIAFAATDPTTRTRRPSLDIEDLASEPIALACPTDHRFARRRRIHPTELAEEPFVDVPATWGSRTSVDTFFADHGLTRRIVIEVGDVATVAELVRAGLGVALLAPSSLPTPGRTPLIAVRPHPTFTVSMVTALDRPRPPATTYLSTLARRYAGLTQMTTR